MRRLVILPFLIGSLTASAQTVADFESLPLSSSDTFYVNYDTPGGDVGFQDGLAYFPCVYDTGWGMTFWSKGFAYSNMTDTVTPGYMNMYAARPGKGANNSDVYVVAWDTANIIHLRGAAQGKPVRGMYVTNSNYAYKSMKEGDPFAPDIFDGAENEWMKMTVFGYFEGSLTADSVEFYLADFRSSDPAEHKLVDSWEWLDLSVLGAVDSVLVRVACSDPDKPIYFCLDDFTTDEDYTGSKSVASAIANDIRIYPNPVQDRLFVQTGSSEGRLILTDIAGRVVGNFTISDNITKIETSGLLPGIYQLVLVQQNRKSVIRFQKL